MLFKSHLRVLSIAMALGLWGLVNAAPAVACTKLTYLDASGNAYHGRTMELGGDLPWLLTYFPEGQTFESDVETAPPLTYTAQYAMFAVTMPNRAPTDTSPLTANELKVVEGINEQGLSISILAYPSAAGTQRQLDVTQSLLSVNDLGTWALGQFQTVEEVKSALADQAVVFTPVAAIGGAEAPVHFVLNDRTGATIVVEFHEGDMVVYDNPVGVMTNGPQFDWHLTNLNNYTHLSNVDQSTATFGTLQANQPDSGIATASLPSSNTSVGRFVRAVFYSQFAKKAADPDAAVLTLARIMNNFDRPKDITFDPPGAGGGEGDALAMGDTEYTPWTILADLSQSRVFLRTYYGLNYTMFDLAQLAETNELKVMPMSVINGLGTDGTSALLSVEMPR
jgi:choloylglycine hydrolase